MSEQQLKAKLMDAPAMQRALSRMAHEILEQLDPPETIVLVGIKRRGVPLARRAGRADSALRGRSGARRRAGHHPLPGRSDHPVRPAQAEGHVPSGGHRRQAGGAGGRRNLHRPHRSGRSGRADGSGPSRPDLSGGAGGPRPPRAAHPAPISSARTFPPPTASALPSASPKSTAKTASPSTGVRGSIPLNPGTGAPMARRVLGGHAG